MIPTLAPYLAPVAIDGLPREIPQLQAELREMVTGDLLDMLGQGRLDAAILAIDVDIDAHRASVIPMYDEPLVILVPPNHSWDGRKDVSPSSSMTSSSSCWTRATACATRPWPCASATAPTRRSPSPPRC